MNFRTLYFWQNEVHFCEILLFPGKKWNLKDRRYSTFIYKRRISSFIIRLKWLLKYPFFEGGFNNNTKNRYRKYGLWYFFFWNTKVYQDFSINIQHFKRQHKCLKFLVQFPIFSLFWFEYGALRKREQPRQLWHILNKDWEK